MRHTSRPAPLPRALPLAFALALAAAAAGCDDAPLDPAAARPAAGGPTRSASFTAGRPPLVANHVRYSDRGHKPATGRAGSASLTVRALLGRDGNTELEVGTSEMTLDYGWGPGEIRHLQVKASAPDGRPLATRVYGRDDLPGGGMARLGFGGLARGTRLHVQAAVAGIDPHRTDVPEVTGTVRLRPNLAVRGLAVPAQVREGKYAFVTATVAETNGDVGASATCKLYVDGVYQDWAQGIWVDAGDAVTCLFAVGFWGVARHTVEVRVDGATPRDDDPSDNAAAAAIEVVQNDELSYWARAERQEWNNRTYTFSRWTYADGSGTEFEDDTRHTGGTQFVAFDGSTAKGMSALPRVEIAEESGGAQVFAATYDLGPGWTGGSQTCGQGFDDATAVLVWVCTGAGELGGTSVSYQRVATRAVYHSAGYSRTWDGLTGEEQVYHYNRIDPVASGLAPAPVGSDYTIRVRLVDGGTVFFAEPTIVFQTVEAVGGWPLACFEWSDEWSGITNQGCSAAEYNLRFWFGTTFN